MHLRFSLSNKRILKCTETSSLNQVSNPEKQLLTSWNHFRQQQNSAKTFLLCIKVPPFKRSLWKRRYTISRLTVPVLEAEVWSSHVELFPITSRTETSGNARANARLTRRAKTLAGETRGGARRSQGKLGQFVGVT